MHAHNMYIGDGARYRYLQVRSTFQVGLYIGIIGTCVCMQADTVKPQYLAIISNQGATHVHTDILTALLG